MIQTELWVTIPQPNIGDPGTGDFTLMFLGEAGVVGRPDIVRNQAFAASVLLQQLKLVVDE